MKSRSVLDLALTEPSLAQKVAFLSRPGAYSNRVVDVLCRETHMSWVFLAGAEVYKLKKPVRFPYLDFSTLARRELACRAELRLNRRLAKDVYRDVVSLSAGPEGLSIGGQGPIVDWLVVMRRLDERFMLDHVIADKKLARWHLDRTVNLLLDFYRKAPAAIVSPAAHLNDWRQSLAYNRRILLDLRFRLPSGLIRNLDKVQRRFLRERAEVLERRVRERQIIDGHGDLRPEHIWLGDPVRIIDCLEFNARLRANDPLDEIAFLSLECERLGAPWARDYLIRRMTRALPDGSADELIAFYRCHRAMLRARLAIAHLIEPIPRTPEKWPRLARMYLRLASKDAALIERLLNRRGGHRAADGYAAGGLPPRTAATWARSRVCLVRRLHRGGT